MRVPQSLSSVGFYGKTTKLRLTFSSVVEFKTGNARLIMTLQDLSDQKVKKNWSFHTVSEQIKSKR